MKINTYKINLFCIIIFSLIISVTACKKDDDSSIGDNFLQDSDRINFQQKIVDVICSSILTDSIINSNKYAPLGRFYDPKFGFVEGTMAFQIKPGTAIADFNVFDSIQSVELQICINSCYGDSLTSQNIDVYKLTTALDAAKTYYSNHKINSSDIQLIKNNIPFVYDTSKVVRLSLPISFAEELLNINNASNYESDEKFIEYFKGFYLCSKDDFATGGGIFTTLPTNEKTKLVITYKSDGVEKTISFKTDTKLKSVSMLTRDYSYAIQEIQDAIADTSNHQICYIQGLGGVQTKLNFSNLNSEFSDKNISINRAKLTIHIKNIDDIENYPSPKNLYLVRLDDVGNQYLIQDLLSNSLSIYDGTYHSNEQVYTFNITTEVQSMLKTNNFYNLYLIPSPERNCMSPHRVCLFGNSNDENKIQLEIYYSYKYIK
jgi:hypothetical protein